MDETDATPLRCVILLSSKSSGSSAVQALLTRHVGVHHLRPTRHFENETLYWTKAASLLGLEQLDLLDSEVPIPGEQAGRELRALLADNTTGFVLPSDDRELVMQGWRALCASQRGVLLEKSPHHLVQWSSLELILEAAAELDDVEFLLLGLVRNPMDTLYSAFRRWGSDPEGLQREWATAARNLLRLVEVADELVHVVRYEDVVRSLDPLVPVLAFCGADVDTSDPAFLHARSVARWRADRHFGFVLDTEVVEVAQRFGYTADDLRNEPTPTWSSYRRLGRAGFAVKGLLGRARIRAQRLSAHVRSGDGAGRAG